MNSSPHFTLDKREEKVFEILEHSHIPGFQAAHIFKGIDRSSCADPKCFVRGGPTLTVFFFFF